MGNSFRVDWKRRVDLPFEATSQMFNPLNEDKPVRICRDGQEVPHELGQQLTGMMDRMAQEAGIPPPRAPAANPMPAGETSGSLQAAAHALIARFMLQLCLRSPLITFSSWISLSCPEQLMRADPPCLSHELYTDMNVRGVLAQGLEGLPGLQGAPGAALAGASAEGGAAIPAGAPRRRWTCAGACRWTPWACP